MDGGGAGRLVAGSEGPHSGHLGGHAEHCGRAGASRSDRLSPRAGGAQPYDRGFNAMTGSQAEVGGSGAQRIGARSEEHTSELQSLMRTSYAVFCLKKKKIKHINTI